MLRALAIILLASALTTATASAEMPPHLVLARPCPPYSPAIALPAQAYPYGYFGARGGVHWQRQFGLYRNYTQWSQK